MITTTKITKATTTLLQPSTKANSTTAKVPPTPTKITTTKTARPPPSTKTIVITNTSSSMAKSSRPSTTYATKTKEKTKTTTKTKTTFTTNTIQPKTEVTLQSSTKRSEMAKKGTNIILVILMVLMISFMITFIIAMLVKFIRRKYSVTTNSHHRDIELICSNAVHYETIDDTTDVSIESRIPETPNTEEHLYTDIGERYFRGISNLEFTLYENSMATT